MTQRQTKKLFDCRCADLALHFLRDEWSSGMDVEQKQLEADDLAAHIQEAVEGWFSSRAALTQEPER